MGKIRIIILAGFSLFLMCSCSKQSPVEAENEALNQLSGSIENWDLGTGCTVTFLDIVATSVDSPYNGIPIIMGKSSIDGQGHFSMQNIQGIPDSLYKMYENPGNYGLFENYSIDFHGYTNTYIMVRDSANRFKGYLIYSTQSTTVLPYVNENSIVGDYTMTYQYSNRDISIDSSSTGQGVNNLTLTLTYKMSLKKGWNKTYVVTTYVSGSERHALFTTTTPKTPGKWCLCTRPS